MIPTPLKYLLFSILQMGVVVSATGLDRASIEANISELHLHGLEDRRSQIDSELENLARYSMRSGVGSIGYRSLPFARPEQQEWVQIDLREQSTLDEIILVPTISREAQVSFIADGFPEAFSIIAGKEGDETGTVVATFTKEDGVMPRTAPLVIPMDQIEASWIRIEATLLSSRAYDGQYNLQFYNRSFSPAEKISSDTLNT
jgi:hypothetical protein